MHSPPIIFAADLSPAPDEGLRNNAARHSPLAIDDDESGIELRPAVNQRARSVAKATGTDGSGDDRSTTESLCPGKWRPTGRRTGCVCSVAVVLDQHRSSRVVGKFFAVANTQRDVPL